MRIVGIKNKNTEGRFLKNIFGPKLKMKHTKSFVCFSNLLFLKDFTRKVSQFICLLFFSVIINDVVVIFLLYSNKCFCYLKFVYN